MCGFVGILNKNGHMCRNLKFLRKWHIPFIIVARMKKACLLSGNCGFFHKRLSIIDLKTGQQPMTYQDCTIVFNGEIYNYIELRNDLDQERT